MTEPIFDYTTEDIYERLPEHFRRIDPTQNHSLKRFIAGSGKEINRVRELIRRLDYTAFEDGGEPGETSDLVDPRTADLNWLPWLSQLLGVNLRSNVVDENTRNEIINATNGYKAGTDQALIAAVQSELVGSKSVRLKKRTTDESSGGPWDLLIQTLQSETLSNILPQNIIVPTSARNLEFHSVPEGFLDRVSLRIEEDTDFYKSRAIEFRAVPQNSGIGSQPGDTDDGYGEDDFGLEAFGIGDDETTGPTEYYFYTSFYFELDGSDPLTTFIDVKYLSGTNSSVLVTAGIELFNLNNDIYTSVNTFVGTQDEAISVGDTHHLLGRNESIPINATHGRWLIRFKNVGKDAIIHVGHFGARKENEYKWVPRSANPIQAVIDRGAKPAGLKLWHSFSTSAWDNLENGGSTTWNDIEALPNWVAVEEFDNPIDPPPPLNEPGPTKVRLYNL